MQQSPKNFNTPAQMVQMLRIIYFIMLYTPVVLVGLFHWLIGSGGGQEADPELHGMLKILFPVLAVGEIGVGFFLFKQQLERAKGLKVIQERLGGYFTASIIRLATVEGACLLMAVGYFLTADQSYVMFLAAILLLLLTLRPSESRFEQDMMG